MITKEQRALLDDWVQLGASWHADSAQAIRAALATIDAQREEYDDMVRAFCRAAGVERDDHGQAVERVTKMRADIDAQRGQLDAIEDAIIGHDDEDMKHPKCTVAELVKRVLVERDAQREELDSARLDLETLHRDRVRTINFEDSLGMTLEAVAARIAALEAERDQQREEIERLNARIEAKRKVHEEELACMTLEAVAARIAELEAENAALRDELRERPAIQKFMEGK